MFLQTGMAGIFQKYFTIPKAGAQLFTSNGSDTKTYTVHLDHLWEGFGLQKINFLCLGAVSCIV